MNTQLAIVGPEAATSLLTIQKAKLKNGLLYADFTEQHDEQAGPRHFTLQGTDLVHADLLRALRHLMPHLCLLCEQLTETADYWPEATPATAPDDWPAHFAGFRVTALSLGKGNGGVTLSGQRELRGGQVLNLTSPYVRFDDETDAAYPYAPLLETELGAALAEVEAALRGKCSDAGRQLDLFAPADDRALLAGANAYATPPTEQPREA